MNASDLEKLHLVVDKSNDWLKVKVDSDERYFPVVDLSRVNQDLINVIEASTHMHHCLCNIIRLLEVVEKSIDPVKQHGALYAIREAEIVAQNGIRGASIGLQELAREVTAEINSNIVGRQRK
ncbi:hypothetical protein KJBENDCP_00031 [Klebsiella phage vB_KmiS-Kmi2C]|nr:hypothetical protein KJBENDCP_00031 [Klebsiella phage vB_KmiS-Kmi2C]